MKNRQLGNSSEVARQEVEKLRNSMFPGVGGEAFKLTLSHDWCTPYFCGIDPINEDSKNISCISVTILNGGHIGYNARSCEDNLDDMIKDLNSQLEKDNVPFKIVDNGK